MIWEELDFDYSSFFACFIKDYFTYDEMYSYLLPISNTFYQFIIADPFLNQYLVDIPRNYYYSRFICILINKRRGGKFILWYDNGNIGDIKNYKDGKLDGECKCYYETTGKLFFIENYKKGLRDGEWKSYYRSGQLFYEGKYKNGKTLYKNYYETTGKIKNE